MGPRCSRSLSNSYTYHRSLSVVDELTEFEAGEKGPGRLLSILKERGIIYSTGSDRLYYYDGLAMILKEVEAHGLINHLLVNKSEGRGFTCSWKLFDVCLL